MKNLKMPAYKAAVRELCESTMGDIDHLQSDSESATLSERFRSYIMEHFGTKISYLSHPNKAFSAERSIGILKDRLSLTMHSEEDPALRLNWLRLLPTVLAELNSAKEGNVLANCVSC